MADKTQQTVADETTGVAPFPNSWVIDVCRTCGRVATWPFCEHRDQARPESGSWCTPITVKGTVRPEVRLPRNLPASTDAEGRDE